MVYTYDADGQRASMTDGTGRSTYTYDSLHRLTQSVSGANQAVGSGYDLKGQLTSIAYPGANQVVNRAYDAAGRLTSVGDWLSHSTSFGYDANSNLATETYPNTTKATSTYDAADQLMAIADTKAGTPFLNFTYTRDQLGQLTTDSPTCGVHKVHLSSAAFG